MLNLLSHNSKKRSMIKAHAKSKFSSTRVDFSFKVNEKYKFLDRSVTFGVRAHYYSQPPSTLGLGNFDLGLYLDG